MRDIKPKMTVRFIAACHAEKRLLLTDDDRYLIDTFAKGSRVTVVLVEPPLVWVQQYFYPAYYAVPISAVEPV